VATVLVDLTAPIRAAFEAYKEWQKITLKEKKVKDKGSRYPGTKPGDLPIMPVPQENSI
jgi:tyrosyl-tRNA synthetase